MKLILKNIDCPFNERLHVACREVPCLDSSWHYHPQYEILYISNSSGIRFVGDSVAHFTAGDLVLVGSYLPHLWRNDPSYYKDQESLDNNIKTVVLKFMKNFIGEGTFDNPEFSEINKMLKVSKFGISFGKSISKKLHSDLIDIVHLSPVEQSIQLLKILYQLSQSNEKRLLSSTDMRQYALATSHRLDAVVKYISDNYAKDIELQDVADIACMTTNSFCRFFKKMTNKSFTQFLNEVRVRNASRLLLGGNLTVTEVCYSVGYKSITNFYKQFKQVMGSTPKMYRQSI